MTSAKIKVGIAGWSYPDWRGIVYPDAKTDMLSYAAQFVDVIEINSTFYRPALSRDSQVWLNQVRQFDEFFFTAKLHQDFTHAGVFDEPFVARFKDGLAPLLEAGRLKQLLAQFSYGFNDQKSNRLRLEKIVGLFSRLCPLAVELRHRSWERPAAVQFLKDLQVSVCDLDYPAGPLSYQPKHAEPIGPHGYFRMHGRDSQKRFDESVYDEGYDYIYSSGELEEMLTRIERLAQPCDTYIVIANNHYRGAELANAIELKAMLTGLKQRFPEGLLIEHPELIEYAENAILF